MNGSTPRKIHSDLTPERFGRLLLWLSPDREIAGKKYEQIRCGLIKIFRCRGCVIPEELADDTINRVARKIEEVAGGYVGEPAAYFYSVAEKIYLEHQRTDAFKLRPLPVDVAERGSGTQETELKYKCLERCVERLPSASRELIHVYYGERQSGKEKIDERKELANRLGIGTSNLWLRAHRIREGLKRCMIHCLQHKESEFGLSQ